MQSFAPEMQVKQHVAVVAGSHGQRFRVFTTGGAKYYLFSTISPLGVEGGLQFPVRKADLRDDVRRMLTNGCGNSL